MKTAVAYIRVSTEDQKLGMESQLSSIKEYCERNGYSLAGVHTDHGVSGGLELDKRPALLAAMDEMSELKGAVLVVAKRCRLARDGYVAAMVYRLVERKGSTVECADGVGNGDSAEDKLLRGMLDLFAEYERELIRGRTRAALAAKKRKNEYTGGRPKYGWQVGKDGKYEPIAEEQKIANMARQLQSEGKSLRAIKAVFEDEGIPTRDGRSWNAMKVRTVIRSEVSFCPA
jgi:DNA invertase Pin-like site-specific DNA recombinase